MFYVGFPSSNFSLLKLDHLIQTCCLMFSCSQQREELVHPVIKQGYVVRGMVSCSESTSLSFGRLEDCLGVEVSDSFYGLQCCITKKKSEVYAHSPKQFWCEDKRALGHWRLFQTQASLQEWLERANRGSAVTDLLQNMLHQSVIRFTFTLVEYGY